MAYALPKSFVIIHLVHFEVMTLEALTVVADQHWNRSRWMAVCVFCVVLWCIIVDVPVMW